MQELYTEKDIEKLKKEYKVIRILVTVLAAAAVMVLVVLCCLTGAANEFAMEKAAILIGIFTGWLEIYLLINVVAERRAELRHAQMLKEPGEEVTGQIELSKITTKIKGSVYIKKVRLITEQGSRNINIIERKANLLEQVQGPVKVRLVHSYIAGFEVKNENN